MKKNINNLELKIYEFLGVKYFKKLVFKFRDMLVYPFTMNMNDDERKKILYNSSTNYNIGRVESLEDIKRFKKMLYFNALIHIIVLIICVPNLLKIIGGTALLKTTIINLSCIFINIYCIMLQRYNYIRINRVIKKMTPKYEKQKAKIREELKKEDTLLSEHTYKVVNVNNKEKDIMFDELIENANIKQLKKYREYLDYFRYMDSLTKNDNYYDDMKKSGIIVKMGKGKTLKMKIKNK